MYEFLLRLSPEEARMFAEVARRRHLTKQTVARTAIRLLNQIIAAQNAGQEVVVRDRDGKNERHILLI